ncbi:MAG: exodeoxyribonuclease VII large subunit [Bacilli bacterium]|nr:exodeoxyribonuclease VII large subunit [Bacilli bacterium]
MRVDLDKFRNAQFLSVTALNRYINYKFDSDIHLQEVYLRGEISNFKISGRHAYFSLKDEYSVISAMIFNYQMLNIDFNMEDGIIVGVVGTVKVYEKRGSYSIVINHIERDGVGKLYQEFLELKDKLEKEGLFDIRHKLPLPEYPMNVAVITAATGDAIHDIISTFNRRLPMAKITLYPALVQGLDAPMDLVRALKEVYQDGNYDALIIGRGGGSYEDLSCFNNELLARTLFASPIPTVTGIGHDADFTICDFVSSFRAPTPTGAAMVLTKEKKDIMNNINSYVERLNNKINNIIINNENLLNQKVKSYGISNYLSIFSQYENKHSILVQLLEKYSPKNILINYEQTLDNLESRLKVVIRNIINNNNLQYEVINNKLKGEILIEQFNKKENFINDCEFKIQNILLHSLELKEKKLDILIDKAIILNPLNLMSKGYAVTYQNNKVVSTVKNLDKSLPLEVRMKDGKVVTSINEIEESVE